MRRVQLLVLPALAVVLGGCSIPNIMEPDPEAVADAKRVGAVGVSFENPEGFRAIDVEDLTGAAAAGNEDMESLAASAGMDQQALLQVLRSVDLYLVGSLSASGYAENISVADAGGAVPGDKAIRAQFEAIGADIGAIEHVDSDLGEVTTARFTLRLAKRAVEAEAILLDADGTVIITVSTLKRGRTTKLVDRILETLDED